MHEKLTRRGFLVVTAAADVAFARASQAGTPVNFAIPAHACDCHTHIFGDPARFPFFAERTYTLRLRCRRRCRNYTRRCICNGW